MAKKKHAEEHENLERWLVSYADFMTLLFATFVVLYALAQSDVNSFKGIEEALKRAFQQSVFDNQTSILNGTDSVFDGYEGATNPLMLEYMSQKYEQSSFDEIEENIENLHQDGLSATQDDRGLVIRFDEHAIKFKPATADLTDESLKTLSQVAKIIKEKFSIHFIEVEGHTDSDPIISSKFPSNWELSSARAASVIRYLIKNHGFNSKIFMATGLADTVPIVPNTTIQNKAKNRRVEIIILKNKNKNMSKKNMNAILKEVQEQQKQAKIKKQPSKAIEGLVGNDKELLKNVIDMTNTYESENKRLDLLEDFDYMHDGQKPTFMEK
ncbi:MAG: OmpA family protein [Candidatus Gastranaerophilales bacterium]|nr:OmpA family protein [Candidatus Gastranaerophilales bacterium]